MSEINQNQSKFLYIAIGMLVPIVAALIPYAYKYFFPEHDLNYRVVSSTQVKEFNSVNLELVNNGESVEKDVIVLIKKSSFPTPEGYKHLDSFLLDIEPRINYKISETSDNISIGLGNIRPREKLIISFTSPYIASFSTRSLSHEEVVIIKSDDNLAKLLLPSEFLEFAYPVSFWILVLFLSLIFIVGIYMDILTSPEKKKVRLNNQIKSLEKQIQQLEVNV